MTRLLLAGLTFVLFVSMSAADEPRVDAHGDPLPDRALLRIGTERYRAGSGVNDAAMSPDGRLIACNSSEAGVAIIDLETGRRVRVPDGGLANGYSPGKATLAFSPDAKELFGVTQGGNIRVWDTANGKQLRQFGSNRERRAVAVGGGPVPAAPRQSSELWTRVWFPARGKYLVCASGGAAIARVDPATGKNVEEGAVVGQVVGTDAAGETVIITDPKRGTVLCDIKGGERRRFDHIGPIAAIAALSADGKRLATAASGWQICVWDVESGKRVSTFTGMSAKKSFVELSYLAFAPDGKTLFVGTEWGEILRFDLETGKALAPLTGHRHLVTGLFFSPGGKMLVSTSWDATVRRWDVATGKPLPGPEGAASRIVAARRPDGRIAGVSLDGGWVVLWDLTARKVSRVIRESGPLVSALCYSPDGQRLAIAQTDGGVTVWQDQRPAVEFKLPVPTGGREAYWEGLAFSPDSRGLLTSVEKTGIRLWDASTGKELWSVGDRGKVAFAPDGRTIATGGSERTLQLRDAATGRPMTSVNNGADDTLDSIAFSPDGVVLATSHHGGMIYLRDPETGQARATLRGHTVVAWSLSFTANGRWLASCGDTTVCLWDVASGTLLTRFEGHASRAYTAEISPEGRTILSTSMDLTALLWDARPKDLAKKSLDALWGDLGGDPVAAWRAVWALADDPASAAFLGRKIAPAVAKIDEKRVAKLIDELDSANFREREAAERELAAMGRQIEPALRKAMDSAKSTEVRRRLRTLLNAMSRELTTEELRQLRAVHAMELATGPAARQVLQRWSAGSADAVLTREAKAALGRLK